MLVFLLTDQTVSEAVGWHSMLVDESSSRMFISVLPRMPIDFHFDLVRQSGSDNGKPVPHMSS